MKLKPLDPFPPGNPMLFDFFSMGVPVHENLYILTTKFGKDRADSVILVDPTTGERKGLVLGETEANITSLDQVKQAIEGQREHCRTELVTNEEGEDELYTKGKLAVLDWLMVQMSDWSDL